MKSWLFVLCLLQSGALHASHPGPGIYHWNAGDRSRIEVSEKPTAVPTARPAHWLREVLRRIGVSEYSYVKSADGEYSAPNRFHGLQSRVWSEGIEVCPRESAAGQRWKLTLTTVAFGYEGALPARLQATPTGFSVTVAAAAATYPITIDPVFCGADWTSESNQAGAGFGTCVSDAGDVNGDGFADVIVGAPNFGNVEWNEGRAFLYFGSPSGPSAVADWIVESNGVTARLGYSVSGAGDINGDGFDDVIVGAPYFDGSESDEGRAFLYLGSPSGPSVAPHWTGEPGLEGAFYGFSVAGAGDVNADAFDDVIIGAIGFESGMDTNEGRTYLYLGSATGLSINPDWTAEGNQRDALFGESVSGAGDVNGDGFDDVIIGAEYFDTVNYSNDNEGRAFLYLGSATGLSASPNWSVRGEYRGANFGASVSGAGDVNGDGFADVIVGADGIVFLFLGSVSGLPSAPDWTVAANQTYGILGYSVSGAGDLNGDGFDDVIAGVNSWSDEEFHEGGAFFYLGSASGLSTVPWQIAEIDQENARFGASVSRAGNVDGDGLDDVVVGAHGWDNGENAEGAAFLYLGSTSADCNCNGGDDRVDIGNGTSQDCNANGIPDECERDCNSNGIPDECDITSGTSLDCNGNDWPDDCEATDCNANGVPDDCDISSGSSLDCNSNDIPDDCETNDCNGNGIPDKCDLATGSSQDCNCNWIPDECDILDGTLMDADGNGIPDECETLGTTYCNANGSSTGFPACIAATGSASAAAGDLVLTASPVPNQPGIFFHGAGQNQIPWGCSYQCAVSNIARGEVIVGMGNVANYVYDNANSRRSVMAYAGSTRNFQLWYRDPMNVSTCPGGATFNSSKAISIAILP